MSSDGIVVENLRTGYSKVDVVKGVDLTVAPGEVVALLGPNGAGKTTLLLAIAGELALREGSVLLDGELAQGRLHRRAARGLGYLPEQRAIFRGLTVAQNLDLGRGGRAAALELAPELRPMLARRAGLLSGGEQQLLCLSRLLAVRPKNIIVDELSLGLAPMVVSRLMRLLREAGESGAAVLLVEQQVPHALAISKRAYVMNQGVIVFNGATSELSGETTLLDELYFGEPAEVA